MEFGTELQHVLESKRHHKVPLNIGAKMIREAYTEINRKGSS